ncbi:MAG: hypothetical protein ABIG68_12245 [Acidobacteriota bacterium]
MVEKKNYDPLRMAMLRSLPQEIKETLTQDEVDAFLLGEEMLELLADKLKNYLEDVP